MDREYVLCAMQYKKNYMYPVQEFKIRNFYRDVPVDSTFMNMKNETHKEASSKGHDTSNM